MSGTSDTSGAASAGGRWNSIDWLRGFVMVLMAIDHSSAVFNSGRIANDTIYPVGAAMGMAPFSAGDPLPAAQFLTRWITHLCAPTFLFLSGTSLAMSIERRRARGETAASIDRHLLIRGLVLLGIEAFWMSLLFSAGAGYYNLILQVLAAIGFSFIAMIPLRRLSAPILAALGLGWWLLGEALVVAVAPPGTAISAWASLFAPGDVGRVVVMYPVVPWLAIMVLGWAFGARYCSGATTPAAAQRAATGLALIGLGTFAVVRGLNGYGNLGLLRDGASLVQWLHVQKYPPCLAYAALELGLMAVGLAVCIALERRSTAPANRRHPLLVYGSTALFFYVIHIPILAVIAGASGQFARAGLVETYLGATAALVVLYPICTWYRGYKARNPEGWPRYV